MKKRFIAFLTFILAVIMSFSCLSACNLVTVDNDRDMSQTVATVQIDKKAPKEIITKKDLMLSYYNIVSTYGSSILQYYTQASLIENVLESLISNKILVQNAMAEFFNGDYESDVVPSSQTWKAEDYLNEKEKTNAYYSAYKDIDNLIESYTEKENKVGDDLSETVRTVPTNATNDTEVSDSEKFNYVENIKNNGFSFDSASSRKAKNSFVNFLDNNGLLGKKYDGDLRKTYYFEQSLKSYTESELLNKFEKAVNKISRGAYSNIESAYVNKYEEQKDFDNADFASKLSSATASDPVLYSAYGNYGYVYNLLLGVNDIQSQQISAINSSLSTVEKASERRNILSATTVKDLRSTWVLSGYDMAKNSNEEYVFTGDYSFIKDVEKALPFQGTIECVKEKTDTEDAEYSVTSLKSFGLDEFISFMNKFVYDDENIGEVATGDYYRKANVNTGVENYAEKINDILFAFSTDPGSLNTYKGYVISPDNTEGFVETFSNAGKELLEMGGNSYIIVASDYGYHVMFFSEVFNLDYNFESLTAYLDNAGNLPEGFTSWEDYYDNYLLLNWEDLTKEEKASPLYLIADALTSTKVSNAFSKKQNGIISEYRNSNKVSVNKDAYSDLLG